MLKSHHNKEEANSPLQEETQENGEGLVENLWHRSAQSLSDFTVYYTQAMKEHDAS